ncbi:MAG: DUF305 domain-containing protein [Anaerolineales bacterium]|nr:DUF305 domain-containing protein [Anaerolineales bacterium]MCB9126941.1 DUF305 domain-containing protein [Ardenticatenales bacterium]MCB9171486.1 DUF305 domain-containing protein [Ardenticatenales bacterium]
MLRRDTSRALSLLLFLWLTAACAPSQQASIDHEGSAIGDHAGMNDMSMGVTALEGLSGAEFEIAFLDMMIAHHDSAIEMAKIAQDRSARPEIKAVAEAIITTQQSEIDTMQGWLQGWYEREASGGDDHGMSMTNEVEALRTMPSDQFDLAFLEAMTVHHEGAIQMAELVAARTDRPELTALATAIISAQQAEVAQFERWRSEWHEVTP